jgi:cytochrome c biogenesis protein CcmG/thiol:disulfide interchange protein DsbE
MTILFRGLPFVIFAALVIFFWRGLSINPQLIPSTFINKSVPIFDLSTLQSPQKFLNQKIFLGHVSLLNVFASWCDSCAIEHPFLVDIAQKQHILIYGLDYKDNRDSALLYLKKYADPYQLVLFDGTGQAAIDWGVYGTPETFVIDSRGIIRYKQVGILTNEIWQTKMLPLIMKLELEGKGNKV